MTKNRIALYNVLLERRICSVLLVGIGLAGIIVGSLWPTIEFNELTRPALEELLVINPDVMTEEQYASFLDSPTLYADWWFWDIVNLQEAQDTGADLRVEPRGPFRVQKTAHKYNVKFSADKREVQFASYSRVSPASPEEEAKMRAAMVTTLNNPYLVAMEWSHRGNPIKEAANITFDLPDEEDLWEGWGLLAGVDYHLVKNLHTQGKLHDHMLSHTNNTVNITGAQLTKFVSRADSTYLHYPHFLKQVDAGNLAFLSDDASWGGTGVTEENVRAVWKYLLTLWRYLELDDVPRVGGVRANHAGAFYRRSAYDILFGHSDVVWDYSSFGKAPDGVPYPGLLSRSDNADDAEELARKSDRHPDTMLTGVGMEGGDLTDYLTFVEWNGSTHARADGFWDPQPVAGLRDGSSIPPFHTVEDDAAYPKVAMFWDQVKRAIPLEYAGDAELHGIPLWRYKFSPALFLNATTHPDNAKWHANYPDGFLSLWEAQAYHIMLSRPFQAGVDEQLRAQIKGQDAQRPATFATELDTTIDYEPFIGLAMSAHSRIQLNWRLEKSMMNSGAYGRMFENHDELYVPMAMVHEWLDVGEEEATEFKAVVWKARELSGVFQVVFIVSGVGCLLWALLEHFIVEHGPLKMNKMDPDRIFSILPTTNDPADLWATLKYKQMWMLAGVSAVITLGVHIGLEAWMLSRARDVRFWSRTSTSIVRGWDDYLTSTAITGLIVALGAVGPAEKAVLENELPPLAPMLFRRLPFLQLAGPYARSLAMSIVYTAAWFVVALVVFGIPNVTMSPVAWILGKSFLVGLLVLAIYPVAFASATVSWNFEYMKQHASRGIELADMADSHLPAVAADADDDEDPAVRKQQHTPKPVDIDVPADAEAQTPVTSTETIDDAA